MSDNHKNLNGADAAKSRDAMAKEIYRRLFGWIVDKVRMCLVLWGRRGRTRLEVACLLNFEVFGHEPL